MTTEKINHKAFIRNLQIDIINDTPNPLLDFLNNIKNNLRYFKCNINNVDYSETIHYIMKDGEISPILYEDKITRRISSYDPNYFTILSSQYNITYNLMIQITKMFFDFPEDYHISNYVINSALDREIQFAITLY